MPAKPMPLVAVPPGPRPRNMDPRLWAFPQRLADAANNRGIGQQELAKAAEVAQSSVSRWLHYQINGLTARHVIALEKALGLPFGWLLEPPSVPVAEMIRSPTPVPKSSVRSNSEH